MCVYLREYYILKIWRENLNIFLFSIWFQYRWGDISLVISFEFDILHLQASMEWKFLLNIIVQNEFYDDKSRGRRGDTHPAQQHNVTYQPQCTCTAIWLQA